MPATYPKAEVDPKVAVPLDPAGTYGAGRGVIVNGREFIAVRGDVSRPELPIVTPSSGPQSATIAAQTTPTGRTIQALARAGGRIYAGYGDSSANTGPIRVTSVSEADPLGAWTDDAAIADTEAIVSWRKLSDGRLIGLHVDPRLPRGGYVERAVDGTWTDRPDQFPKPGGNYPQHVQSMVEFGSELWATGSTINPPWGAIWRSVDGGATWTTNSVPAGDGTGNLVVLDGSLYAYVWDQGTFRWTGAAWVAHSENFLRGEPFQFVGDVGVPWRGGWLTPGAPPIVSDIFFSRPSAYPRGIRLGVSAVGWDIASDGALYVLTADSKIVRFAPTGSLEGVMLAQVKRTPETTKPTSIIALSPTTFVLGTSDARVQTVTLPAAAEWGERPPRPAGRLQVFTCGSTGFEFGAGVSSPNQAVILLGGDTLRGSGYLDVPKATMWDIRLCALPAEWLADSNWWYTSLVGVRTVASPVLRGIARLVAVADNSDGPGLYIDSFAFPEGYEASLRPTDAMLRFVISDMNFAVSA